MRPDLLPAVACVASVLFYELLRTVTPTSGMLPVFAHGPRESNLLVHMLGAGIGSVGLPFILILVGLRWTSNCRSEKAAAHTSSKITAVYLITTTAALLSAAKSETAWEALQWHLVRVPLMEWNSRTPYPYVWFLLIASLANSFAYCWFLLAGSERSRPHSPVADLAFGLGMMTLKIWTAWFMCNVLLHFLVDLLELRPAPRLVCLALLNTGFLTAAAYAISRFASEDGKVVRRK